MLESGPREREEFKDRFNPDDERYVLHVARRVVEAFELYRKRINLDEPELKARILEETKRNKPKTYRELYLLIRTVFDEPLRSKSPKK